MMLLTLGDMRRGSVAYLVTSFLPSVLPFRPALALSLYLSVNHARNAELHYFNEAR